MKSGTPADFLFPLRRHDGIYRPFLTRAVPIRDSTGEIVRWFGTNTDISQQVETSERLRQAEAEWRNLFDEMQEGIVVVELRRDADGNIVDGVTVRANSYYERLTGIPTSRILGVSIFDRPGTPQSGAAVQLLPLYSRVAETGRAEQIEAFVDYLDRWFDVRIYRHSPTQVAVLYLDVTERKAAREEARHAQENLMRVSRLSAMGAMASTLAHELNQPIGAASNYLAAAGEHVKRAAAIDRDLLRNLFDNGIASCQRAGQIIRSMRNFTASGTVEKKPELPLDLIRESIEESLGGATHDEVEFAVDCPPDLPPILCDRTQITQVLLNLYNNGKQAMAASRRKRIAISARASERMLTLRIEDSGPGFKDRAPEDLFEPFWSTTDVGLGLGLPLCRTIVEAHGGSIRAEPGSKSGACFIIELPITAPQVSA